MQRLIVLTLDVETKDSTQFYIDLHKQIGIAIGTFIDDYDGNLEVSWLNTDDGYQLKIEEV
jgi:hypothetical protein